MQVNDLYKCEDIAFPAPMNDLQRYVIVRAFTATKVTFSAAAKKGEQKNNTGHTITFSPATFTIDRGIFDTVFTFKRHLLPEPEHGLQ